MEKSLQEAVDSIQRLVETFRNNVAYLNESIHEPLAKLKDKGDNIKSITDSWQLLGLYDIQNNINHLKIDMTNVSSSVGVSNNYSSNCTYLDDQQDYGFDICLN